MSKNTVCIWYDKDAEAAARFYAETFPDSSVGAITRAPGDYPVAARVTFWWWNSPSLASPASD